MKGRIRNCGPGSWQISCELGRDSLGMRRARAEAIGGIGLELRAFTEYAFAEFDMVRIYAHFYEWNPASVRVLE